MAFGYAFVTLDDEQKHARRVLLEYYPKIAELSVLLVFVLFQVCFSLSSLARRVLDHERPRSPAFNKHATGKWAWLSRLRQNFEVLRWWMRKPVIKNWGTRGEWVAGGIWTAWLLYLCVAQTGNDYMHLTKRFGIIGASQLPLQYLLAMRSPYSPIQLLTRMSHEQLKASHQVLGRIVFFLFILHAAFYLNFFVLSGFLAKRIKDTDVIFGVISIILFSVLSTTALGQIRRRNYRIFYISHIAISNLIIIPLYFHVTHIRPYVYQVVLVNVLHLFLRARSLKIYSGMVRSISGTNLVQVRIPLTGEDPASKWKPGQHVYLSRPSNKPYSASASDQLSLRTHTNPFTVASVPGKDRELLLVARALNGNTKHLAALAQSVSSTGSDEAPDIELAVEGPYGASVRLPDLSSFDRILFVAGGVGATFVLPIYRSIIESGEVGQPGGPQIRFIWAVRKLADILWAFPGEEDGDADAGPLVESSGVVEVFVTRRSGGELLGDDTGDDIEMAEGEQLLSAGEQMHKPRKGVVLRTHRPQMPKIVDEVFSQGSRIAVIACGPKTLSGQLSDSVEKWIRRGHEVYWHDETFGW